MRLACGGCREADGSCTWRGNSRLLLLLILPRARNCWVGISMLELLLLILPEGRMLHESLPRNILDMPSGQTQFEQKVTGGHACLPAHAYKNW